MESQRARWLWHCLSKRVQSHATDVRSYLPRWRDRRLAMPEEPAPGAHLVTPRIGFVHHGIYLGNGRVIHCGAVSCFLPGGPVEEVSMQEFSRERPVAVRGGGILSGGRSVA